MEIEQLGTKTDTTFGYLFWVMKIAKVEQLYSRRVEPVCPSKQSPSSNQFAFSRGGSWSGRRNEERNIILDNIRVNDSEHAIPGGGWWVLVNEDYLRVYFDQKLIYLIDEILFHGTNNKALPAPSGVLRSRSRLARLFRQLGRGQGFNTSLYSAVEVPAAASAPRPRKRKAPPPNLDEDGNPIKRKRKSAAEFRAEKEARAAAREGEVLHGDVDATETASGPNLPEPMPTRPAAKVAPAAALKKVEEASPVVVEHLFSETAEDKANRQRLRKGKK
ncbi:hypothetical protein QBC35DRAFT_448583 [Podospora australis]|uniref:Uncharacterized protein n=1 Tax=Podospora australis TaxID=1536484 RepID=A0AAN6WZX2_9PEZI|nr:hypothetical protein QBC35DRAFT_448583 [Podospora australis]